MYPVSLFIFFYIFNHFPFKSGIKNTTEDTICLLHTKIHQDFLASFLKLIFNHKLSKPNPEVKTRLWKSPLAGVFQTELLLKKVARNYLLLTGYHKHENNTYVSHFNISSSITLILLMGVFLKMLPAFSMTILSKLQETRSKMVMNHQLL